MAANVSSLSALANLSNATTAVTTINTNSSSIQSGFTDCLSRSGTAPNQMGANIDMNSNRVINLPAPGSPNDAARFVDITGSATISSGVITAGTSAQLAFYTGTSVIGGATKASYVDGTGTLTLNSLVASGNLTVTSSVTFSSSVTVFGSSLALLSTTTSLTNNAGASSATLTNAPSGANPTKWIAINDAGTTRFIPAW